MLKTVVPHDLVDACRQVGINLAELTERTGIPESELLDFAAGHHALKASDRFAIIMALTQDTRQVRVHPVQATSVLAARALIEELYDEDREEEEREREEGERF